jgi:hypothetical protein
MFIFFFFLLFIFLIFIVFHVDLLCFYQREQRYSFVPRSYRSYSSSESYKKMTYYILY